MGLRTEYSFTLPKGYVDQAGTLHRQGTMRLATARDEIEPLRDPRISGAEDPYLTIVVLARVITELGTLADVSTSVVEGLFAADLAFLQDVYGIINFGDPAELRVLQDAVLAAEAAGDELDELDDFEVVEEIDVDAEVLDVVELGEAAPVTGNVFAAATASPVGMAASSPSGPTVVMPSGSAAPFDDAGTGPVTASLRHRIEEVRSQNR
ncbi:MAG: hypothetical protein R2755_35130 [Acidimicrobiales bacterium]